MSDIDLTGPEAAAIYDATGQPYAHHGLPPSFPEHIRRALEREIIEGQLEPGERVTEEELAQRMGVSRTPVREALRALAGQGLIERRRGRGIAVAERLRADEAEALYEIRGALEGHLAARAAEAMTPDELETAASLQRSFRRVLDSGDQIDTRQLVTLDSDLHWTIYNAARSTLAASLASYWGRMQRELYDPVYRSDPQLFAEQHEQLIDALRAAEPEQAEAAMRAHVRSGWQAVRASFATGAAGGTR
jgi:DNA-binding GntR family transcriptional regulator